MCIPSFIWIGMVILVYMYPFCEPAAWLNLAYIYAAPLSKIMGNDDEPCWSEMHDNHIQWSDHLRFINALSHVEPSGKLPVRPGYNELTLQLATAASHVQCSRLRQIRNTQSQSNQRDLSCKATCGRTGYVSRKLYANDYDTFMHP